MTDYVYGIITGVSVSLMIVSLFQLGIAIKEARK